MQAKQPGITLIRLVLIVLVISSLATSCGKESPAPNESKLPSPTPTTTPNRITISAKAKQIEAVILRDDLVDQAELAGLPPEELRILRNVAFARHGMQYEKPGLGDYFYYCDWYKPNPAYTLDSTATNWRVVLTENDKKNRDAIKREEDKSPGPTSTRNAEAGAVEETISPLPGRCPEDVSFALCSAIAAQGLEKLVRKEGLLKNCSEAEATDVIRQCTELAKTMRGPSDQSETAPSVSSARNLAERAVVNAVARCEGKADQAARRDCLNCALSCAQEGRERALGCERKWPNSQTNVEKCLEETLLQSTSCFAWCR